MRGGRHAVRLADWGSAPGRDGSAKDPAWCRHPSRGLRADTYAKSRGPVGLRDGEDVARCHPVAGGDQVGHGHWQVAPGGGGWQETFIVAVMLVELTTLMLEKVTPGPFSFRGPVANPVKVMVRADAPGEADDGDIVGHIVGATITVERDAHVLVPWSGLVTTAGW